MNYVGGMDYRNKFLEMIDEGLISTDSALQMLVGWNSQNDMHELMVANELLDEEDYD